MLEQECDQQPAHPSVSVEIGVDCFELCVEQSGSHQFVRRVVGVDRALEMGQDVRKGVRRRGHEHSVAGSSAADPVLTSTHLARLSALPRPPRHQPLVRPVEQTDADRQTLGAVQLRSCERKRRQVITDLVDVRIDRRLVVACRLERQEVDKGCLCALDLGRQHGLLAHERIDQPVDRRHHFAGDGQPR